MTDDHRIRRRGCAIFAGVFAALFACCAIPGWFLVWGPWLEHRGSGSWIETICTVTTSSYEVMAGNRRQFRFAYDYSVDGRTYTGHRYSFTDQTTKRNSTSGMPPLLTLGSHRCHDDPENHASSVIVRDFPPRYEYLAVGLLVGSAISLFAVAQWIRFYRDPAAMRFLA